jgi:hypothetical protein
MMAEQREVIVYARPPLGVAGLPIASSGARVTTSR